MTYFTSRFFRQCILVFLGLPLLIWAMGDFTDRSLLKESLSLITILALFQMVGQFFWTRTTRRFRERLKMSRVLTYHKIIGYTGVVILLFHPLYLVIPRFFEAGVPPIDAFFTIITTLNQGVVLGIIAWFLMLVLGITSFFRGSLPMKYTTWRVFHGILAMLFIVFAAWHTMDLGRHADLVLSIALGVLTAAGILLLLKTYMFKKSKHIMEA